MRLGLLKVLVMLAVLLLVGCTMRPPPAGLFMASYQSQKDSSKFQTAASITKYVAIKPDSLTMAKAGYDVGDWNEVVEQDYAFDYTASISRFIGHWGIGLGIQFLDPYITTGFASNHFGVMGWTDWSVLGLCFGVPDFMVGGVSIMEQISPTPRLQLGLTQFASRTRAYYVAGTDDFFIYTKDGEPINESEYNSCMAESADCEREKVNGLREPYSYRFIEYGIGAYMMYEINSLVRMGFEFKYSYDVTYKASRLAFSLNLLAG